MKFTLWIDGCYYYEDEEYEVEVDLSEEEVASIRKMVNEYEGDLSRGLMPVLKACSKELYQKFYDVVYPDVFYSVFKGDNCFEPLPQDEDKSWTFDDVYYLMETYGDNYDCDDAYQVFIPDDMKPPKIQLSKGMSKEDLLKYIRQWNSMREGIFDWITTRRNISTHLHDSLYEVIEKRLLAIAEQDIAETDEYLLLREGYDPFCQIFTEVIADEMYEDFQKENAK